MAAFKDSMPRSDDSGLNLKKDGVARGERPRTAETVGLWRRMSVGVAADFTSRGRRDGLGDVVLDGEDVDQLAMVPFPTRDGFPSAAVISCAVTRMRVPALRTLPSRTVRYTERLGDSPDVLLPALECECRRARDRLEVGDSSRGIDDFLGQAVAEPLVIPARTHVCKRQNGNRPAASQPGSLKAVQARFSRRSSPEIAALMLSGDTGGRCRSSAAGAWSWGGSSRITALTACAEVCPANARVPDSISYKTAPKLK